MFAELPHWQQYDGLAAVLAEYPAPCRPERVERLVRAGLSGAEIFRLTTGLGPLCLRRWPAEHPTAEQLRFMHGLARHVWQAGFARVAVPLQASRGESFVRVDGHFWELTPWLPGAADWRARPSAARLAAAMQALAEFHVAAASFSATMPHEGASPNIARRMRQAEALFADQWRTRELPRSSWPELLPLVPRYCAAYERVWPRLSQELAAASQLVVPQQPCLRDIWHDNVLFEGDRVSGLVDFGALAVDSVATDVARLLGSLAADDRTAWASGLVAYGAVRELSPAERTLIDAFDHSFVALAGFQWLEWIVVDQREFADRARVLERIEEILGRLEFWAG